MLDKIKSNCLSFCVRSLLCQINNCKRNMAFSLKANFGKNSA